MSKKFGHLKDAISELKGLEFSRHIDFVLGMAKATYLKQQGNFKKAGVEEYSAFNNLSLESHYCEKWKRLKILLKELKDGKD